VIKTNFHIVKIKT